MPPTLLSMEIAAVKSEKDPSPVLLEHVSVGRSSVHKDDLLWMVLLGNLQPEHVPGDDCWGFYTEQTAL